MIEINEFGTIRFYDKGCYDIKRGDLPIVIWSGGDRLYFHPNPNRSPYQIIFNEDEHNLTGFCTIPYPKNKTK